MTRTMQNRLAVLEAAAPRGRIVGRTFMPPLMGKAAPDGVSFIGYGIGGAKEFRYSTEAALRDWLELNPAPAGEIDQIYSVKQCAEVLAKLQSEI
ncbi:hypothetical protein [Rhodoferax sp.]|uniref:hypothetical protein n=1 Tax=Rhodoferax sp. TaxID=50421 RepID=UPI0025F49D21|nr:hypothetical protein [Rhodoferax sp.]